MDSRLKKSKELVIALVFVNNLFLPKQNSSTFY